MDEAFIARKTLWQTWQVLFVLLACLFVLKPRKWEEN